MPDTDYKAICDATREKCGTTGLLKSGEIKPLLAALETDGAKFYLTVNVDSGSTVVATKGSLSVSGTAANGKCVLELPEAGEWTVTATLGSSSASGVVNVVGDYATQVDFFTVDPVFANNSWAKIIEACQKRKVPDSWKVADQKAMTINGTSYLIDIIGKNHDPYADGSGYAPLTLQMHDCYGTTYAMNSTNTNVGGWGSCIMRSTHLPVVLAKMPDEVKTNIRKVNKLTGAGNKSSTIEITADNLFFLSSIEVHGSTSWAAAGEGSQYAYYAAGNSKAKTRNGSNEGWWLRSPEIGNALRFVSVNSSGSEWSGTSSEKAPIAPAFCF
jgi:hypothetical protein